jgi:hypothetical protein
MDFVETTFTSVEAECITGIAKIRQRDWRRHGYLAGGLGRKWKRYTLSELAQLAIISQLKQLGLPPASCTSLPNVSDRRKRSAAVIVTAWLKSDPRAMDAAAQQIGKMPVKHRRNPPRFLVVCQRTSGPPQVVQFAQDLQGIFHGTTLGAVVIDLRAIARQIIDRSGRPLVRLAEQKPLQ